MGKAPRARAANLRMPVKLLAKAITARGGMAVVVLAKATAKAERARAVAKAAKAKAATMYLRTAEMSIQRLRKDEDCFTQLWFRSFCAAAQTSSCAQLHGE